MQSLWMPPALIKPRTFLGLLLQIKGTMPTPQHAYERSIQALEGLPNDIRDYAMVLDDFGGLYVETGQPELQSG